MNFINQKLKQLRLDLGLSVDQVVFQLSRSGELISADDLCEYEIGRPVRSKAFLALCGIYFVADIPSVFLSDVLYAKSQWDKGTYEDYFNSRTVNEKYELLFCHGIPNFVGYEKELSDDVFFGQAIEFDSLSDFERSVIRFLRQLSEARQQQFLTLLMTQQDIP